jgi:uncharacterized repeat protein (TIGR01451 family)
MKTNQNIVKTAFFAALSLLLLPGIAAAQEMKVLHGHVPSAVSQLHLKSMGQLPNETSVNLAIGLPVRNADVMSNLFQQVSDPSSPNYRHYLTPDQFTAQFGPSEEDYQKVVDFAKAHGLTVTGMHPNRMVLDVRGRAADVENAFRVTLRNYHHPSENRDFFAPDTDPSVPSTLPVLDVLGLDNYRRPHPHYHLQPSVSSLTPASAAAEQIVSGQATTGSGPNGNYIGNDFRNAYIPGSSLNGAGQTVALVQFDGYSAADIAQYESMAGRTNVPLQNVLLDGFSGAPTGNGGEVEVSLDIEMVVSMAPALAQIVLYEGNPFNFFPNDVLNRIATDDTARQISCSWGWGGGPSATTDQIFQEMALQGQTFYDAVGDSDAFTSGANSVNGVDNPFLPNAPSDSPYITQVGGTTLTMNSAGAAYSSETVWNWDIRYGPAADGIGSSGGISSFYTIPSWQTNVSMALNQGSTTFRNVPDVALTADDVFVIADSGVFYTGTGGTSCASPLWAGFTALINQQATNNFLPPVGFINPALYSIGNSANYTNCFHDITTGNNTWSSSPTAFFAVSNYDLCTGLGTPNGTNLINTLTAIAATNNPFTHLSAPLPPYGGTMSALNGGNPNGNWFLFVQDDETFNSGMISNGWSVTLTTANPVGFVADDYLAMTASGTNVIPGAYVNFVIGVTNYGPSTSSNVDMLDTFPAGFTLISTNSTQGTVVPNGAGLVWEVGNMTNKAGARLNMTLQAPSTPEQDVNNLATVSSDTPDQNPADGSAFVTLNVVQAFPPVMSGAANSSGGKFLLSVSSPSSPVIVQGSTNLVNWVNLSTNTPPFIYTDSLSAYPYRFYRALLQ